MRSAFFRFSSCVASIVSFAATPVAHARDCPAAVNQALAFSGAQVVTVPHAASLNPGAEVTVECWVRPDQAQQTSGLVSKWNDISASQRGYLLWLYNGIPWFSISPAHAVS